MSVLVTTKFSGDTAMFLKAVAERGDEFAKIADEAKGVGAIHHRFGVGDGFVLVVDEWESAATSRSSSPTPSCRRLSARRAATRTPRRRSPSPRRSSPQTSSSTD